MKKKILMACLCVALAVLTIAGTTLAYLTSTAEVKNTFTVGNVSITLDEKDVDKLGVPETDKDGNPLPRVNENDYKLMPGHTYVKDPTVHVAAGSEDCWIFVKVENGIAAFEAATVEGGYKTIADQIAANGWTPLTGVDGVDGVYYKEYEQSKTATDLVVFENFQIANNANSTDAWKTFTGSKTITVTAYAIQKDGFDTVAKAWAEVGK